MTDLIVCTITDWPPGHACMGWDHGMGWDGFIVCLVGLDW
jgi:hypothetical protein